MSHIFTLRVSGKSIGRPQVWPALLALAQQRRTGSLGPYRSAASAVASAGYFNAQMRIMLPKEYETFRFRGRGDYVYCFSIIELRGGK